MGSQVREPQVRRHQTFDACASNAQNCSTATQDAPGSADSRPGAVAQSLGVRRHRTFDACASTAQNCSTATQDAPASADSCTRALAQSLGVSSQADVMWLGARDDDLVGTVRNFWLAGEMDALR